MANVDKCIQELDEKGYTKIPQVFDSAETSRALELVNHWFVKSRDTLSDKVPFLDRNQPMVYNLQNKDYFFVQLLLGPSDVERVLIHFLNDEWFKQIPKGDPNYIMRSYLARSSQYAMPLHIDSFVPYLGSYVVSVQVAIILQDMNQANGCTLVVPGSHKSGKYVKQESLKDAIPLEAKTGDVLIWDSRLWHGAAENTTKGTRWAIIGTFIRWWIKQHFNVTQAMPREIFDQLSNKEKAVMGFCSVPHLNEEHGIDMKRGYDDIELPQSPMSV